MMMNIWGHTGEAFLENLVQPVLTYKTPGARNSGIEVNLQHYPASPL
ncbi:hypothetical protein [Pantoea sp. Morm]